MTTRANVPIQPVASPIICSPYVEPGEHWVFDTATGSAARATGRRPASYWYKTERTGSAQRALPGMAEEQRDDLPLVNLLRADVRRWREKGYQGASNTTKELLNWWASPTRSRRLFFCQREAVETMIYLAELRIPGRSSRTGFRNFDLSDANLALLLKGERPRLENLVNPTYWPTLIDRPADPDRIPLRRLGCKMATGSGKTVVMSMLIAWAFCNRGRNPQSVEYSNAVLVCCPNLTVKERLQVLRPEHPDNYYAAFDLVPTNLRPLLQTGKVIVENWHGFAPESEHKEGDKTWAVVDKGPETPETIARRVLGDLYERLPIMVLNDEGHHCWRPAPVPAETDGPADGKRTRKAKPAADDAAVTEDDRKEARVWLEGLDQINNCVGGGKPGIALCIDLSATPFYLSGSGYPEGQPFPWLVSDFGLVDAIESGLVKIPRLPVMDTAGKQDEVGRPDPKYFRLWQHIVEPLAASEKHKSGKPKAEVCYREAEGALKQIASQWLEKFRFFEETDATQVQIPPVLILVCDNTEIADIFYRKISGETESDAVTLADVEEVESGEDDESPVKAKAKKQTVYGRSEILDQFANTAARKVTVRIDSKLLAEAESASPNATRKTAAEELRRVISTVGRRGEPGEQVRCVVSVSMLTEGWDACNVTHILGIRAFGSQLLCEQVVGRGLRRMNYTPVVTHVGDKTIELLSEECVDVYGIPFSVIPYKGRTAKQSTPEDRPDNLVRAIPERAALEIRFPIVEGFVFQMTRSVIRCDLGAIEPLRVDSQLEPTTTYLCATANYADDPQATQRMFEFVPQDRHAWYEQTHMQTILFRIAHRIVDDLVNPSEAKNDRKSRVMRLQSRHHLFPQVFGFVRDYVAGIDFGDQDPREVGLERYARRIIDRLRDAIEPDDSAGEPPMLPILNRYQPWGTTARVKFLTKRTVSPTMKSHVNVAVQDSRWEGRATQVLDLCDAVKCYVRNDHLGLAIRYESGGIGRDYEPDFVVRLTNEVTLLVEIKGYEGYDLETQQDRHNAATRWAKAVSRLPECGRWEFALVRDVDDLSGELQRRSKS